MVKDFSQKMIKNIEGIELPCLEKMLSSRFGYTTSGKFICEKCNFVGKNLLALSVHKRTCDKTLLPTQEVVAYVSPMNIQLSPSVQPAVVQQKQIIKTPIKKGASHSLDK